MYKNLVDILKSEGYTNKFVADLLKITDKSLINKTSGITAFTLPEYEKLCELLNKYRPKWLFTEDDPTNAA